MEITQEKFKELESEIFRNAAIESLYDDTAECIYEEIKKIKTWDELKDLIIENITWVVKNSIPLPDGHYKNSDTEFTVVDGMLNGKYLQYHHNGKVEVECDYLHGKRHGECIFNSSDGKVIEKFTYNRGRLHGEYVRYYPDGNLAEKCNYFHNDKYDVEIYDIEFYYPIINKSKTHFEYALIPIEHASKALVEVCNDKSIIKPYYEPRFDKHEVPEYEWDKRPNNAILITQELFGAYEQEYIEKVYGGSWHVNNELSDETPYVLDILKGVYGEKEIDKML